MKIRPEGGEFFHKDRKTDRRRDTHDGANSHFSQCCERT